MLEGLDLPVSIAGDSEKESPVNRSAPLNDGLSGFNIQKILILKSYLLVTQG